ncbi:D-alanyl-lipoteichoic acid biosynthesis protein DltD [Janthinobacterium sp. LB2P49]|uniref:D-alanyl-lipoteichoic acid biosynthesis protein DltD n=1 Tax=Janthinobacterium sp. LB2P49 TaxID=3424198 RepID=UPI003F26E078
MLARICKSRLFLHVGAIAAASLIGAGVYFLLSDHPVKPPSAGLYLPNIGHGKEVTENIVQFSSALASGKTAVILGSSELSTPESTYIPYNYLPKKLHVPVLAYGHAHFQSFGIYGLLAANTNALSPQSKVILLLSPGWFNTSTTPSAAFIEHFQPQILSALYQVPDARKLVSQYIQLHKTEFDQLSLVQQAFSTDSELFMYTAALKEGTYAFKSRLRMIASEYVSLTPNNEAPKLLFPSAAEWQEQERIAQSMETDQMRKNTRWVRDDYHEKYLKSLPTEGAAYFSQYQDAKIELAMLKQVLDLLKKRNVQALLIMQTINPHVYKDANRAKQIGQQVSSMAKDSGMHYFDMNDAREYRPGLLRDGMHIGELGWVTINRRIMEYMVH